MNDAGHGIQIDIQTAPISVFEQSNGSIRYVLGYINGEFTKNITIEDLYLKIWFKRGLAMEWENINYKLNSGRKVFRQKIIDKRKFPQQVGLIVTEFYVQLYGWVSPSLVDLDLTAEFELTDFELSVKEIPIGKFGGEPLGLVITEEPIDPVVIPDFLMYLDTIGDVTAISARAVWFTTHPATTRVIYGLSPLAMNLQVQDLSFSEFHDIKISSLSIGKTYYAQFFSISKITGEEIYSDIKIFYTGSEVIIDNILPNSDAEFLLLPRQELEVINLIYETEQLLTSEPDGENVPPIFESDFSLHTKTEIEGFNLIENEFNTSLS